MNEVAQTSVEGQLNAQERALIANAIESARPKPRVAVEVGTWLGGGSTLHILRALHKNGEGHLWGVEADRSIYDRMVENIRRAAPEAASRFTPLFGLSSRVLPRLLAELGPQASVDFAFLDGGNNPAEQINEFQLLADRIPVGGRIMAHDAKLRKGKWLRPYVSRLDNWELTLHDVSEEGLLDAVKMSPVPTPTSLRTAGRELLYRRLAPAELAARWLPGPLCGLILRLLPRSLSRRLSDGRR